MLTAGQKAPGFNLVDQKGQLVQLSDFLGKKVVLYFYPKDNTPGCTKQACAFKQAYDGFKAQDIVVIGISKDSSESHQKFAQQYDLPFILLTDPNLDTVHAYGVWQEKKIFGKLGLGIVRATFIIDEAGIIDFVFEKAKPDTNAAEILAYLAKNKN